MSIWVCDSENTEDEADFRVFSPGWRTSIMRLRKMRTHKKEFEFMVIFDLTSAIFVQLMLGSFRFSYWYSRA